MLIELCKIQPMTVDKGKMSGNDDFICTDDAMLSYGCSPIQL